MIFLKRHCQVKEPESRGDGTKPIAALLIERTYTVELDLFRFADAWVGLNRFLEAVIGIGLGIAIAFAASNLFKFPFVISHESILLGFGLTFVIGLLAGVIPARNAASLDPITALRSD